MAKRVSFVIDGNEQSSVKFVVYDSEARPCIHVCELEFPNFITLSGAPLAWQSFTRNPLRRECDDLGAELGEKSLILEDRPVFVVDNILTSQECADIVQFASDICVPKDVFLQAKIVSGRMDVVEYVSSTQIGQYWAGICEAFAKCPSLLGAVRACLKSLSTKYPELAGRLMLHRLRIARREWEAADWTSCSSEFQHVPHWDGLPTIASCVLNLNDDFVGGEIVLLPCVEFDDSEARFVDVPIQTGRCLLFDALRHMHAVRHVRHGIRWTLVLFWEVDEASQQGLLELVDPVGVDPFPYKLSARFGAYVQSLFRAFDSDKDGFLNSEELQAWSQQINDKPLSAYEHQVFSRFMKKPEKGISQDEFVSVYSWFAMLQPVAVKQEFESSAGLPGL